MELVHAILAHEMTRRTGTERPRPAAPGTVRRISWWAGARRRA